MTAAGTLALGGVAFADIVTNDIDAVGDYTISAGASTRIGYTIQVQGTGHDGEGGCNASLASPAVVTLAVPASVAADRKTLTFTSCATFQYVTFSAATSGDYPITVAGVADTGPGSYVTAPASFTLKVAPPANTPPTVSVTGVANGATYAKSSTPQPGCSVVDAEDTGETATAQVSNGAHDALGSHTVTCAYTDSGNLTGTARATYTVVRDRDGSAPVVDYTVDPGTPDGTNGWYTGAVSLDWTVTEPESPETLTTTPGCIDLHVTGDQAATTYTCTATSEGGTDSESVTIKRDSQGPTVSYDRVVSGLQGNGDWYRSDVTVRFTATDTLSGPATAAEEVTTSGDGTAVTVGSPAFTDEAGNITAENNQTSPAFKIDSQAPNAPTFSLSSPPNTGGWHNRDVTVRFAPAGDHGPSGGVTCTSDIVVATEGADRTASGTCTDAAGNTSPATTVTIDLDKTAPTVSYDRVVDGLQGNGDWYRSAVTVRFTATDTLSGPATAAEEVKTSGDGTAVTVASPAFTDAAGNTTAEGDQTSPAFKIDTAPPAIPTFHGGPSATYYFGNDPAAPTCTSSDATSGVASCVITGGGSTVGPHTYTATATDNAGNRSTTSMSYTVLGWDTRGYFAPVDMGGVWNVVKGGSTVPLKFEVFSGSTELTSTSAVKSFVVRSVACPSASAPVDEIETVLTGATNLRYDSTGGQFIQNWQTPKKPGTCAQATTTMQDGSSTTANFLFR